MTAAHCCGSEAHHCEAGHHHVVPALAQDCDEAQVRAA